MSPFAERLLVWHAMHGRHDLPWQHPRTPYRVWLSEVMLQQTKVATVIPYFERFLARFPDVESLAAAEQEEVLRYWAGLGYYARGRNLHACARAVRARGGFPSDPTELAQLPGIGPSTAAAIAAQAYGVRAAILDGNVKRVLARWRGVATPIDQGATTRQLQVLADALLPDSRLPDYTQALMDLGATLCRPRQPECARCPVAADCVARREGLQSTLPVKKAPRARREKHAAWLVLLDPLDRVLLEQRPPLGLWGGLWTLPEADSVDALLAGLPPLRGEALPLPAFRHAFTHFELQVSPVLARLAATPTGAAEPGRCWRSLSSLDDSAASIAAPTPVRRLLKELP
ncbi:MAG: A/G-specific adenine glycosylase [Xanthomonadales bacterium]|nr:A/G-specific adenine glycosylase [Xanthomonadales bacterium]